MKRVTHPCLPPTLRLLLIYIRPSATTTDSIIERFTTLRRTSTVAHDGGIFKGATWSGGMTGGR